MYNRVIMLGNLTRDIELRYTPNGTAIAKCGIATNRKFKSQTGEQKEEVCFVDITIFGRAAEIANQYLRKGRKVLIEGRLVYEQWTDQSGNKRSRHSVAVESLKMVDNKNDNGQNSNTGGTNQRYAQQASSSQQPQQQEIPEIDINDDEIPF